jgi:LPS export ABC transporter protein LptC
MISAMKYLDIPTGEMMRRLLWVAGVTVLLAACGRTQAPTDAEFRELPADQIMVDVIHTPTSDGIRSALGKYDTVYVFEDSTKLHLKGVNLEMFDGTGRKSATLTSTTGQLNTDTQAMVARGNVHLVTHDNRIIETEELHYDPTSRRIWSDVATTQRYQGDVLRVDGFKSDDQFNKIEFIGAQGRLPGTRVQF